MSRLFSFGALLTAAVLLVACDSAGGNEVEDISGTWEGTVNRQGTEYTITLDLEQLQSGQLSNLVEGNGEVKAEADSFSFAVRNGSFFPSSNKVSLPQEYKMGRPGKIRGTTDDELTTMTVTIIGGPLNFDGEEFSLSQGE